MPTHKIDKHIIHTRYVFPPIPIRQFDWSAVTDDYEEQSPIGYGETEQAAIADLLAELAELAEYDDSPYNDYSEGRW